MRLYKTRWFSRFAQREGIEDGELAKAVARAGKGLVDANLGGGVIKQRVARPNGGKSGGFRVIVLIRSGDKAFLVYGFAKNNRENIGSAELEGFRQLAKELFGYDDVVLGKAVEQRALLEVTWNEEDV